MDIITAVIILLVLGIILTVVELFLIPGITFAGVAAIVSIVSAVSLAFIFLGAAWGTATLVIAIAMAAFAIWVFLRSGTLEKISLKTDIDSKIEPLKGLDIKAGNVGTSVSRLAPMGKVKIGGSVIEAKTQGEFIDQDTEIVVVEVYTTNVLVELKTKN